VEKEEKEEEKSDDDDDDEAGHHLAQQQQHLSSSSPPPLSGHASPSLPCNTKIKRRKESCCVPRRCQRDKGRFHVDIETTQLLIIELFLCGISSLL